MEDLKISLMMDDGSTMEFTVLEQTMFQGRSYLLVTDAPDDEDGECRIFKDVSDPEDPEAIYEDIQDEKEEDAVYAIFMRMLDGEIEIER